MYTAAHEAVTESAIDQIDQKVWPIMSSLVHDLRQPLSIIDACADYLNLVLPDSDCRARQKLELLQEQISEANRILHEALLQLHYPDAVHRSEAVSNRALTKSASSAVTY